jgi:predicted regulator of Ras-like GTPase activity (Roadblock/LC7/MglB family)
MSTEKEFEEAVAKIEADMSGFIAASVVDLESGMTLTTRSARSDFDLAVASAYNSELVKQKLKIMRTLGLGGTIEDMLITLSDQIHLVKLIGPNTFLYLAVDRKQSNLAIVRNAVNKHANELT